MSTVSSSVALKHLQKIKPGDGWSIQEKDNTVRLLRRGIPLTDNYFLDIHYNGDQVVGILSFKKVGGGNGAVQAQAQVLVDPKGQPVRGMELVSFSWEEPRTSSRTTTTSESSSPFDGTWTKEQHQQLWQTVGGFLAVIVVSRILFQTMFVLYIVAVPLFYLYLVQSCPDESTFDPKKEIKRVLRGQHLPDNDPNKPKGFLSETLARIGASVSTEVATSLGYEVTLVNLAGAIRVANVRVPSVNMDFYWVGALQNWYYVYSAEIPSNKRD